MNITNGVLSRLLTASHEVGKCALLAAGLKEVENNSRSFVLGSLGKIQRDLWRDTRRSTPPRRVVNVNGRVEASGVDDQVQFHLRSLGFPVGAPPGSQVLLPNLEEIAGLSIVQILVSVVQCLF